MFDAGCLRLQAAAQTQDTVLLLQGFKWGSLAAAVDQCKQGLAREAMKLLTSSQAFFSGQFATEEIWIREQMTHIKSIF